MGGDAAIVRICAGLGTTVLVSSATFIGGLTLMNPDRGKCYCEGGMLIVLLENSPIQLIERQSQVT
jgi:hypothetical protein